MAGDCPESVKRISGACHNSWGGFAVKDNKLKLVPGLVAGIVLVVWATTFSRFHADDATIYARVIRQWVHTGIASFNHIDPAFPVTGLAWFLLNSVVTKTLGISNVYGQLRIVSTIFYLASWAVFYQGARRFIRSPYILAGTVLLLVTDEIAIENSSTGMETSMALLVATLYILFIDTRWEGLIAGLALVTRPEYALLVTLRSLQLAVYKRWKELILHCILVVVCASPVLLAISRISPGLPNTVWVKSSGFSFRLSRSIPNLVRSALIVGVISAGPSLALLLAGKKSLGKAMQAAAEERAVGIGLAFVLTTIGGYVVLQNRDFLKARYFIVLIPFIYLALGTIADRAAKAANRRLVVWLLSSSLNLVLIAVTGLPNYIENRSAYTLRKLEVEMLRTHAEPDDVYVTGAIGLVGYETGLDILDLGGLATPGVVPPNSEEECTRILDLYQPDFIMRSAESAKDIHEKRQSVYWAECKTSFGVEGLEDTYVEMFQVRWLPSINRTPTVVVSSEEADPALLRSLVRVDRIPKRLTLYRITNWTLGEEAQ